MRYCHNCSRFSAGTPLFCSNCGRTFDVRVCPRHHVNPRDAQVCRECGSRELTQPQPRVAIPTRLALVVLGKLPAVALMLLSIWLLFAFAHVLLTNSEVQGDLLLLLLLAGMGWLLYTHLPPGMREATRWGWRAVKKVTRTRKR